MNNNDFRDEKVARQGAVPLEGSGGMSIIATTPPGTCPECAVAHAPEQPHNRDSLAYQYKFLAAHGRWPTWADALAHCPLEIREQWVAHLKNHGIEVKFPDEPKSPLEDADLTTG